METKIGKFIVIEGIDGSGKTTQVKLLIERLMKTNIEFNQTVEPSPSPIGKLIRQEYLSGNTKTDEKVITMLFAADRFDHILNPINGIIAQLNKGINVICDRYYLSSLGIQGAMIGSIDFPFQCNRINIDTLRPDMTIFLDIAPETSMARISKNRRNLEIYETIEKQRYIRDKYFEVMDILKSEGEDIRIVDASQDSGEVAELVWANVASVL